MQLRATLWAADEFRPRLCKDNAGPVAFDGKPNVIQRAVGPNRRTNRDTPQYRTADEEETFRNGQWLAGKGKA